MRRLVPFAMVCGICLYLTWGLFSRLRYPLHWTSFAIGSGVAAIVGFLWFRVSDWWSTMTKPYQPQTVKSETKQTPFQILRDAVWATVKLSLLIAFVIVLITVITGFTLGWSSWLSLRP